MPLIVIVLLILFAAPVTTAQDASASPERRAMERAAAYSAQHRGQTMLVMYDGALVFEQYSNGGDANRLQMLASGTKSFVGVLAAAAVEDGLLKLDDPVSHSIPSWKDDPEKATITYRHLLTLTSGLKASENGFAAKQPAWADSAAAPMTGKPGEQFNYGANQLNVFAYALEQSLDTETFDEYMERRILKPLDISIEWRIKCEDGHPQVGGGAFIKSRDWATFGEFVRLQGKHGEKRIVSGDLIAECFVGTKQNPAYGQTWWLKNDVTPELRKKSTILSIEWADVANSDWVPQDLVAAVGAGKQRLYVIPSRKLVIVRQAGFPARGFSDLEFLSLLIRGQTLSE